MVMKQHNIRRAKKQKEKGHEAKLNRREDIPGATSKVRLENQDLGSEMSQGVKGLC